jgi:signal transduction histidine kinase
MKFNSIRWRLVISYVLLTLLSVSLVGMLTLTLLEGFVKAQTESQLAANARAIAKQAAQLIQPELRLNDLREMAQSVSFLGRMRVRILNDQNQVIADSGPAQSYTSVVWVQPDPDIIDSPAFLIPIARGLEETFQQDEWVQKNLSQWPSIVVRIDEGPWGRDVVFETVYGEEIFYPSIRSTSTTNQAAAADISSWTSVTLPIGEEAAPLGFIQLDSYSGAGQEILLAMRWVLLVTGLGSVLIAVIAGLLVSRSLTAPIQALAESATRMSSGDLTVRAPSGGAGEIGQLSQQFNRMAERLQASFSTLSAERDALRRFIGDASHELRTPITALHSFIELMQGPAANDSSARVEFLTESQIQVQRMEWITNNLLDLSRLDAGLIQLHQESCDLSNLLQSAAAPFLPTAQEKGVEIQIQAEEQVLVHCDKTRMQIVLSNMLDNAVKFTPAGGKVEVRGEKKNGGVQISIQDSGTGISSEDLPHIFERFYRGKTTEKGSGLGLSIVQSILQAHGGTIDVESLPGQGSRFTINLASAD